MPALSLVDVVSASYAMQILEWCYRHGHLAALRSPHTVDDLAAGPEQRKVLAAGLEYLRLGTNIVKRDSTGRYALNRDYHAYVFLELLLDKFGAGYGPMFQHLNEISRGRSGGVFVDHESIARAFEEGRPRSSPHVFEIMRKAKARSVLDLGCGAGAFIVEFCERSSLHEALGVDDRDAMCARARQLVADHDLRGRARVRRGDVRRLSAVLSPAARESVDAIHARFVLNGMFDVDGAASSFLCRLRRLFPGRVLVVVDYHGRLFHTKDQRSRGYSQTLLQDLVQVLSGQGVPPAATEDWNEVYERAGCKLLEAHELSAPGLSWFVHSVAL